MKYIVRINKRAFNPLTGKVIPSRLWEIEQVASRDSEKVLWHCADVRIDGQPIHELFTVDQKPGAKPWEGEYHGVCFMGQDNVIEIFTREANVSGHK